MAIRPTIDRPLVMFVYGTRPEAIKMAPLVQLTAQSARLAAYVVVAGTHRAAVDEVHQAFGIVPDAALDLALADDRAGRQTPDTPMVLASVVATTLSDLDAVIRDVRPAAVVVHGGGSTASAAAQAAFYLRVPVVHLEAGLRTNDLANPFPQEANRQLIARLAALHLAPTGRNRQNLIAENIPAERIVVTGNTVIDAVQQMAARARTPESSSPESSPSPDASSSSPTATSGPGSSTVRRRLLVTISHPEALTDALDGIAQALARVAQSHPEVDLLLALPTDPWLRSVIEPVLAPWPQARICDPLDYPDFIAELSRCDLVVSDSGGLQEEGPGLGKPVLVLRTLSERPEGLETGTAALTGISEDQVFAGISRVLADPAAYEQMATAVNPYGDGLASPRCLAAIEELLGVGQREPDFVAHDGSLTRRLRHLTGLPRTAIRTRAASSA